MKKSAWATAQARMKVDPMAHARTHGGLLGLALLNRDEKENDDKIWSLNRIYLTDNRYDIDKMNHMTQM